MVPELSNDHADFSLAGLLVRDEVKTQPALNVGCSDVDVMVPSQGINATGLKVLPADHWLAGWIASWEVQENNEGKAGAAKC